MSQFQIRKDDFLTQRLVPLDKATQSSHHSRPGKSDLP